MILQVFYIGCLQHSSPSIDTDDPQIHLAWRSILPSDTKQSRLNYNKNVHTAQKGVQQECPPQLTGKAEPLGPARTPSTQSDSIIQGSSQNAETKKQITNERNGGKQMIEYRVQNHSYKIFQEFSRKGR
uniref:Uncharacterized protein n=1 Tax=Pipistrellus kuhlii TaxID=59472 RepID=A0A7J7VV67_PIPKU|nr:hypothetical protein mPipKuh1_008308 [Pipistrellus kuhlii]